MLRSRVTVFGILNLTEDSFFKDDLRSLYLKEIFTPFCRIRLKFTGRSYLSSPRWHPAGLGLVPPCSRAGRCVRLSCGPPGHFGYRENDHCFTPSQKGKVPGSNVVFRRRHTRLFSVTGVQTCALPILLRNIVAAP